MLIGEAIGAVGDQAQALDRAIAVLERQRQIVGAAGRGHLEQDLVVPLRVEADQPAPEAPPGPDHVLKRAAVIGAGRERRARHRVLVAAGPVAGPDHAPGAGQRIGDRLPGAQPPERHALLEQAPAEAVDQREGCQVEAGIRDQPVGDRCPFHGRLIHVDLVTVRLGFSRRSGYCCRDPRGGGRLQTSPERAQCPMPKSYSTSWRSPSG